MKKLDPVRTRLFFYTLLSVCFLMFFSIDLSAIDTDTVKNISPTAHHEVPDSEYVHVSRDDMGRSAAYTDDGSGYFTTQVNVSEEGENIVGDAANEPSIAVSSLYPFKMAIGWRQFDTKQSSFRQAGYAYTIDAGETWTFPGSIDAGVFRSDPVLGSDAQGNIIYNSLTVEGNNFYCDAYAMSDGSTDWDEGTYALGGDKQWMAIDTTDGMGMDNIYVGWTSTYSICEPDFFTRSLDGNQSYEDCGSIPGKPFWGTLATGPDGTLYSAGYSESGFIVVKSETAQDSDAEVSWSDFSTVDLDGTVAVRVGPNPDGLLGQTWVAVDHSKGANHGNVYMLCSVERYNGDPNDVMFARSSDGGETWDDPVRINDDPSLNNWQWFGTMSVAPNGRIDVVWLDTRDPGSGFYASSLYYSYSVDGGETFSANEKISESFDPHIGWPQQQKMGDYYHMVSDDNFAHLAWANTLNQEQDTYYTRISPWFVGVDENEISRGFKMKISPNPANDIVNVQFLSDENNDIEIKLLDILGKEILSVQSGNSSDVNKSVDVNVAGLKNGIYFVNLISLNKRVVEKIIIAR